MKRFLSTFLILATLGSGTYLWVQRTAVFEKILSKQLEQETTLEKVTFGRNSITFHHLKIKNKPNPIQPYAFQADKITLQASPLNFLKKKVVIESLVVENPSLSILLFNKAGTEHSWKLAEKTAHRSFQINHYKIDNLTCEVFTNKGVALKAKQIPHIEFLNLGVKGPQTLLQINNTILELIMMRVVPSHQPILRAPSPEAKGYFETLLSP